MSAAGDRALGLARRALNTPLLLTPARTGYEVVARLSARRLAHLPGVVSVHALGSLAASREELVPGQSDIDLTVVTRFEGAEMERAFLAEAGARIRLLSLGHRLIKHLDYVDRAILDLFLHDDPFGVDLASRARVLVGPPELELPVTRPPEASRLARFVLALARFTKAAPAYLDPPTRRPPEVEARGALRLLRDTLAGASDRPRHTPLLELLDATAARGGPRLDLEEASRLCTEEAGRRRLVAHALGALDQAASRLAGAWEGAWAVTGTLAAPPELEALGASARKAGLRGAFAAPRPEPRRPGIALALADSAEEAVEAARRWRAQEPPWAPVPWTASLVRASAALFPLPTGAALARPWARLLGAYEPPPRPPDATLHLLARMQVAYGARRSANRLLRFDRAEGVRAFAIWGEIAAARAALDALQGAPLSLEVLTPRVEDGDPVDAVRALRAAAARA